MRYGSLVRLITLGALLALVGACDGGGGSKGGKTDTSPDVMVDVGEEVDEPDLVDAMAPPGDADLQEASAPDGVDAQPDLPPVGDADQDLQADQLQTDLPTDVELPETDIGKPCAMDSDCDTNVGCLLGFCTALCRIEGLEIEGACAVPSSESAWGEAFACPADLDICIPGEVAGA